ncbi:hypothetical protein BZG36_01944 [Bifiguratus adelaidae]|uniref:F-box domain-containing protein n=1 Tax=Bifiguratus adelaidae TaxID=1938954 RepID=A0A261Y3W3_9FUNG|nr:hypothetical protein BZG36_01944 [Bifiguratus adelaidae]
MSLQYRPSEACFQRELPKVLATVVAPPPKSGENLLKTLPTEVLFDHICPLLALSDVLRFGATCRTFYDCVYDTPCLWVTRLFRPNQAPLRHRITDTVIADVLERLSPQIRRMLNKIDLQRTLVTKEGIWQILERCESIQHIEVMGCKALRAKDFIELFDTYAAMSVSGDEKLSVPLTITTGAMQTRRMHVLAVALLSHLMHKYWCVMSYLDTTRRMELALQDIRQWYQRVLVLGRLCDKCGGELAWQDKGHLGKGMLHSCIAALES